MPDIDPNSVDSINSISRKYGALRQLSKGPTFALTYLGTYRTLMKNFGLTQEEAMAIEDSYHELYEVADQWADNEMFFAHENGYARLAFGLRIRTPLLPQLMWDNKDSWPYQAHKELKTATNALGQSYGLLNSHTANLFMQRVWESDYRTQVLPCAHIHDAQYYLIRNDLSLLKWVNDNLIECMEWNELPEIQHPEVKLGAELDVFYPTWADPITLPNRISAKEIQKILKEATND
jgi:DNA polymerase-1